MFGKSAGVTAVPSQDEILALFGMKPTGKSPTLARPKLKFAKPRFVPTGSISAPNKSMGQAIQDKTGSALRAVGLNDYDASRWAGKLFGAFNDLTPLGNATGADEGARMVKQGVTKGDLMTGLLGGATFLASVLPYGNKASRPLKSLLRDESGAIRAWHGSPHDFDKFEWSPRTRGTGESAQAYGDGLYFAEQKAVADEYRRALSEPEFYVGGQPFDRSNPVHWAAQEMHYAGGDANAAKRKLIERAEYEREMVKSAQMQGEYTNEALPETLLGAAIDLHRLKGQVPSFENKAGRLYEVNINAEPEDFLDWDRPLVEQPNAMRALNGLDLSHMKEGNRTRVMLERALQGADQPHYPATGRELLNAISDYGEGRTGDLMGLKPYGIKGLQFLDQGSRGTGQGTRNFVVPDHTLLSILNKY